MGRLLNRISAKGLLLAVIGIGLLVVSLGDTITSFKPARSFDSVLEEGASAGDHVSGRVPYLLDSFARMETWTENRSNNSRTPAKTSSRYYVLPGGDVFLGLTVHSSKFSAAEKLVDQTYGALSGGAEPTAELELDVRVAKMDEELAELFREELRDYYGFSNAEIDGMGTLLMLEPRAFGTIRVFCGVGAVLLLAGAALLVLRWRKTVPKARKPEPAGFSPELD